MRDQIYSLRFQGVLKAVEKRAHDLTQMSELGDELADKLDRYQGMSSEARHDKETTKERYERICLELRNREQLIEAQVNSADQFTMALQEFQLDLTSVDSAILEEIPGNDSETLKRQLAELQVYNYVLPGEQCVCEGRRGSPCGGVAETKLDVVWLRK